jgi:hypothetical protein
VAYNIPELLESRKVREALLLAAVALLGVTAFGLGRLSATEQGKEPVALCEHVTPLAVQQAPLPAVSETAAVASAVNAPTTGTKNTGKYVASKNGATYNFPWCSGAARIKEENKVWFDTKEAAVAAGYRPAANCKGL